MADEHKQDQEQERPAAAEGMEQTAAEAPQESAEASQEAAVPEGPAEAEASQAGAAEEPLDAEDGEDEEDAPRVKPEVPGAHLEVDIVPEGVDPLGGGEEYEDTYAEGLEETEAEGASEGAEDAEREDELAQPIVSAAIDLAASARYRATGKRKTAVARVILRPGAGEYTVNGRSLDNYFPRATLQRNIRQPLEAVGYEDRMDVHARLHGGGVSSQAGALRHGISKALLEADPNLRGELKRRGFLTRDSRVKERKKAGLKKARKRPQFSKR
ncbi:MAG: 30S ribosomal protein S9 [Acidobacteriota bacterium]|nr:30S ribosomal protein S9 [Acidobacteriota bacterium]